MGGRQISTNRKGTWGPKGKGPNGRNLCYCGCGREVGKGAARTTFESKCYQDWAAKYCPKTQRRLVKERDKGVCAICSVDTEKRAREATQTEGLIMWLARRHAEDLFWRGELEQFPGFTASGKRLAKYREETEGSRAVLHDAYLWARHWTAEEMSKRFGETRGGSGHTWEADHILPVIEGGGECDLSNLRTLCLPCHRKQTAALAKRRAQRRQQAKAAMIPEFQLQIST